MLSALKNLARRFSASSYDAVATKGRRKAPQARTLSEDQELRQGDRQILTTGVRDLERNFTLAAWAIRKHLDYVSTFAFQSRMDDRPLDDAVEEWVRNWSVARNCDAARRHSLPKLIRMAEARRTIDGDVGILKRADGRLQMIEGDRIRNATDMPAGSLPDGRTFDEVVNGVLANADGAAQAYSVCKRNRAGGFTFERLVPAQWLALHGYYTRYDQFRGVSPLAGAYNSFRDVYEAFDYALAKAKVEQMLALVIYRDAAEELGLPGDEPVDGDGDSNAADGNRYAVDFGRGPALLDLDPGDKAEFLTANNPSANFREFTQTIILVALKALDIPLSFYDEAHTNWSGQRQALLQYELSADQKRADNQGLLDELTRWRLALAVRDGELELPAGMRVRDLRFSWMPRNIRWIDPMKEVSADIAAIGAGLTSPQRVIQARGDDPIEVMDQIAAWQAEATSRGLTFVYGQAQATVMQAAINAGSGDSKQ